MENDSKKKNGASGCHCELPTAGLLFHASQTPGIKALEPRVSNHGKPLVYLSDRRENTLVYLSNAVEKFCRETGFPPQPSYPKWGSYGFSKEGILTLDEYYPNATTDTYKGVSGYIYTVEREDGMTPLSDIPHAFFSEKPVKTVGCEFVPDALEALLQAEREGKVILNSYRDNSEKMLQWIENGIREEYENAEGSPAYRAFLKGKFDFLKDC